FDLLEKAGLVFGRWLRQAPYSVHCGVIARIPPVNRIARLPLPEQFAAIELFRGTMLRHSVTAYRSDGPNTPQKISFSDDACLAYMPIRMSDTICIQERLPAGAAAVLINQTHTYRDLFFPIGPAQKNLFDAIDGVRTLDEIVKTTRSSSTPANLELARAFFEQLWWHDQVVFDASHPAALP